MFQANILESLRWQNLTNSILSFHSPPILIPSFSPVQSFVKVSGFKTRVKLLCSLKNSGK